MILLWAINISKQIHVEHKRIIIIKNDTRHAYSRSASNAIDRTDATSRQWTFIILNGLKWAMCVIYRSRMALSPLSLSVVASSTSGLRIQFPFINHKRLTIWTKMLPRIFELASVDVFDLGGAETTCDIGQCLACNTHVHTALRLNHTMHSLMRSPHPSIRRTIPANCQSPPTSFVNLYTYNAHSVLCRFLRLRRQTMVLIHQINNLLFVGWLFFF